MDIEVKSNATGKRVANTFGETYPVFTPIACVDLNTAMERLRRVKAAQLNMPYVVSLYPERDTRVSAQLLEDAMRMVSAKSGLVVDVAAKTAKAWEEVGRAVHEGLRVEMNKAQEHGTRAGE